MNRVLTFGEKAAWTIGTFLVLLIVTYAVVGYAANKNIPGAAWLESHARPQG